MFNLFQIGEYKHCMHCNKALTYQDAVKVYIEETKVNLPHFCLKCKYTMPYIHRVKCESCSAYKTCYDDCKQLSALKQNFSSIAYTDEVKEWLRQYKFEGNKNIGQALTPLLTLPIARFRKKINKHGPSKLKYLRGSGLFSYGANDICCNIVTSVPISRQRLITRGFNQATYFAKEVSRQLRAPYLTLMQRVNGFEHLSHLSKMEREQIVKTLYQCDKHKISKLNTWLAMQKKEEVNIIIVDDIYTTGHTVRACADVIERHINVPCHIYSITLARA